MQHHRIADTEILFAAADAVWKAEVGQRFGPDAVATYRDRAEARGEPGSLLRDAWEARERAYAAWRAARCLEEPAPLASREARSHDPVEAAAEHPRG